MRNEVRNAIIKKARIDDCDRGLLTVWLDLDYGGLCQGFGGYTLYLPKSFTHHRLLSTAGHFIWRCMEIAGVSRWENVPGKSIRVKIGEDGLVKAIGHIINDDWFSPGEDFAGLD